MITITINEEADSIDGVVDILNDVATKVKQGYTSGRTPDFDISGDYEEMCDVCSEGVKEDGEKCDECDGKGIITKTV